MKKLLKNSFLGLVTLCFISCKQGIPENFDYGSIANNTYSNSFFDMRVTIPEAWDIQTASEMATSAKKGGEILAGDNSIKKQKIEAAQINTANLLHAYKFEAGTPTEEFNINVNIMAENIANNDQINDVDDFIGSLKESLQNNGQFTANFAKKRSNQTIGGKTFRVQDVELILGDLIVNQRYYISEINGFCFCIVTSFINEEGEQELESVIKTMKFN